MVMMLRQCCCGCSLKTGAIILGVLNILGVLGTLIDGVRTAVAIDSLDAGEKKVFVAVIAVSAVLGAIQLLVSIFLIIGAQKGKPALLVPWLVFNIVFLIAITILYFLAAVVFFATGNTVNGAVFTIGVVVYFLLQTYFLLVVYSLYRELKGTAPPNLA